MSNDQKAETKAIPAQPDAATTPIDLASAFKMLNQANREAAQEPVDAGDDGSGDASEPVDGTEQLDGTEEIEDESSVAVTGEQGNGDAVGGSADSIEAIDFNSYKQDLLRSVQQDAIDSVRREFNEQNIGYYTVGELTIRDEQTGRVMFRNPDVQDERDPNYYFNSRTEMLEFIDAWNKGVDFEFRNAVNERQQELMVQAAPKARLAEFIPRWQKMSKDVREVFDELLEGHEIRDSSGREIGFNVDLNAVANQAEKIASHFASTVKQVNTEDDGGVAVEQDSPALDMPNGNGKSEDDIEPKSIGEALKLIDKKNRKDK